MVLTLWLLTGCGFHLPQQAQLPAEMARVEMDILDPYSDYARRLAILLEQGGNQVVEDGSSTSVLQISRNRVRKEILTIGDNARVREYRLRHTVTFSLLERMTSVSMSAFRCGRAVISP